jgi:hypothetical protein
MKAKSLTLTTLNFSALHRLRQRGAPDSPRHPDYGARRTGIAI